MTKSTPKKTARPPEDLSYEEALEELEGIVESLEAEAAQNSLEESLKLFERGQALGAHCAALLEAARLKVQQLAGELALPIEEQNE
jgi:exodeoxyribonuclease VII small subunit